MKIGVVGNGGIVRMALYAFAKDKISAVALYCRSEERGRPVAEEAGITNVFTDYDAFLKDTSFDTVYIGLVNSAHYLYARKAIEAGKNVIVEKPFTGTVREAADLISAASAKDVFLFEACIVRYHPNYEALMAHLDAIGDLKLIRCNFSQYSRRYDDYEKGIVQPAFNPELSGGCLYDINVYNVHFVVGLFGAPRFSYYMANKGFNGIDTSGTLIMDYGQFKAVCTGAKDSASQNEVILQGTHGTISFKNRPSSVEEVIYHDRKSGIDTKIDVSTVEDPFSYQFLRIQEVIDSGNHALERIWLNTTMQVMTVLQNGRDDAGIVFPEDDALLYGEEENEAF